MIFYIGRDMFDISQYTYGEYVGRYKEDFYNFQKLTPEKFFEKLIETSKEVGRNEIRQSLKSIING